MFHNSMTPVEHDWRQVGWMLAWVLDSEAQDYHGRQYWNLPAWLKNDGLQQLSWTL